MEQNLNKIKINTFHVFQYKNIYFLFNVDNLNIFKIDAQFYAEIKKINAYNSYKINELEPDFVDALFSMGLVVSNKKNYNLSKRKLVNSIRRQPIIDFKISLKKKTQANCTVSFDINKVNDTIEWIMNNSKQKLQISFEEDTGSIDITLIENFVSLATKKAKLYKKDILFQIQTKELSFETPFLRLFETFSFRLKIILDNKAFTPENIDKTLKKIKFLLDIFEDRLFIVYSGDSLTLKDNLHIKLHNMGVKHIDFKDNMHVLNSDCNISDDLNIFQESTLTFINEFIEFQENNLLNKAGNDSIEIIDQGLLTSLINQLLKRKKKYSYCLACSSVVNISPTGSIYPCHRFQKNESFKLGDIHSKSIAKERYQFLAASDVFENNHCQNCWVKNVCGGGCPSLKFEVNRDITIPNDQICNKFRQIVEKAIFILYNLKAKDREIIQSWY